MDSVVRTGIGRSMVSVRHARSLYFDDRIARQPLDPCRLRVAVMKPSDCSVVDDPEASRAGRSVRCPLVEDYDFLAQLDQSQMGDGVEND